MPPKDPAHTLMPEPSAADYAAMPLPKGYKPVNEAEYYKNDEGFQRIARQNAELARIHASTLAVHDEAMKRSGGMDAIQRNGDHLTNPDGSKRTNPITPEVKNYAQIAARSLRGIVSNAPEPTESEQENALSTLMALLKQNNIPIHDPNNIKNVDEFHANIKSGKPSDISKGGR